jgi:uncharacterized membrane protein
MAKLSKSILINAPVEKIFDYMNDPTNMPEIWPSMVEVSNVKELPNGGVCFNFVYKMAGVRLEGVSEDTEWVRNQRTVSKSSGGIDAVATLIYEPTEAGTRVTVEDEYRVPIPVVGKLAESVITRMNEHEAEVLLANLKTRMEG